MRLALVILGTEVLAIETGTPEQEQPAIRDCTTTVMDSDDLDDDALPPNTIGFV
jgi:hypothetical protein